LESLRGRGAGRDGCEVEYGEGDHDTIYLTGGNFELAPSNGELALSESTGPIMSREAANSRPALAREIVVAAAAFLIMCLVVLLRSPQLMEPDDYAYRASIIALSQELRAAHECSVRRAEDPAQRARWTGH
jgi:hypothetical protein